MTLPLFFVAEQVLQLRRVLGRKAQLIVVEITEDFFALGSPAGYSRRPVGQGLRRIRSLIGSVRTMQPDVDKSAVTAFGDNRPPIS